MYTPLFRYAKALFLVLIANSAQAQLADTSVTVPYDWFLRDPEQDHVQGVSAERTYETLLKDQPSRTVIVAVADTGVDIDHEDLKNVIWTNPGEIADNGIDDDKNGYIDDVHGWNFIGGKNGNVKDDTGELTREYVRLKQKFGTMGEDSVPKKQRAEFESYQKIKDKFEKLKSKNAQEYEFYNNLYVNIANSIDTLKVLLKTDPLTREALEQFTTSEPTLLFAKGFVLNIFKNIGPEGSLSDFVSQVKEAADYFGVIEHYTYNEQYNPREVVGDNPLDPYEKYYGNNDVKGPDPLHGSHVAGIIAADRKNSLGIKGIADNVRIMSVRMLPSSGDERDKDVANAIRYAVDNGAQVINMSFGKSFSPGKEVVDKAVKYAEQKGVLLVHAAGNDAEDNDVQKNFPDRIYLDGKEAKNWLEIGASTWGPDENFVASFSNYGKKSVDFFAPGVQIYSTTTNNTYKNEDGTSMACPTSAGVAALLLSYFPELTAMQVKNILEKSTRKFGNLKVQKPGGKGTVEFSQLSITGGLVNAYAAVKMAQEMKNLKLIK